MDTEKRSMVNKNQAWGQEMYIEKGPDRSCEIIHSTSFILHKLLGFSTDWIKITANVKVLKIMKIKEFSSVDFLASRRKKQKN